MVPRPLVLVLVLLLPLPLPLPLLQLLRLLVHPRLVHDQGALLGLRLLSLAQPRVLQALMLRLLQFLPLARLDRLVLVVRPVLVRRGPQVLVPQPDLL